MGKKEKARKEHREERWRNILEHEEQGSKETSTSLINQYQRAQWMLDQTKFLGSKLEEEMWMAKDRLETLQEEKQWKSHNEEISKKLYGAERLWKMSRLALMR